jgi:diketogulonate reductase-like aldo/keto reductase
VSQYEDPQYLDALQYLAEDERVRALGLCNFDTQHMEKALAHGVKIHSNQVQVTSLPSRHDRKRLMCVLACCEFQLTKSSSP